MNFHTFYNNIELVSSTLALLSIKRYFFSFFFFFFSFKNLKVYFRLFFFVLNQNPKDHFWQVVCFVFLRLQEYDAQVEVVVIVLIGKLLWSPALHNVLEIEKNCIISLKIISFYSIYSILLTVHWEMPMGKCSMQTKRMVKPKPFDVVVVVGSAK